jgi:hypothetical protein
MDERRTLYMLAWTVGGIICAMFILNGIALSSIRNEPELVAKQMISSQDGPEAASLMAFAAKPRGG